MLTASDRHVLLAGGFAVPCAALSLLLALEAQGFAVARSGDDLLVSPGSQLTPDDRAQIRIWKHHLLALVDYQAPAVLQ